MMKSLSTALSSALLISLLASPAAGHPASGIVVDPQGCVYFTYGPGIVRVDAAGEASMLVEDTKHEKFDQLHHVFLDREGNLYTASDMGSGIWSIAPDRKLSRFYPPPNDDRSVRVGLGGDPFAIDANGSVYAVNAKQDKFTQVLKITPQGKITILAGDERGHADGKGAQARFGDVHGGSMVIAPDGLLYLTDDRRYVRKIAQDGTVSTLAGGAARGYADGRGAQAKFDVPSGLAVDATGNILVADYGNHRIRKITPEGAVTTLAGSGQEGSADGPAAHATFHHPTGVAAGPDGEVYVLEFHHHRVRKISPDGRVTTLLRELPGK